MNTKLNLTRSHALKIACAFIDEQQCALDSYGGYPGDLHAVRDYLISFVNCNGEKRDGSRVDIMSRDTAIEWGVAWFENNYHGYDETSCLDDHVGIWGITAGQYADGLLSQGENDSGSYDAGLMAIA